MATTPERTTSETIFQACLDLHNASAKGVITRSMLADATGLKMGIIDDHVSRLVDSGRLRRLGRGPSSGQFEVVEQFPCNRPISKTVLPNRMVIIEVGDDVSKWTPSEAGIVWSLLHGEGSVMAQLQSDRDVQDKVARLERDAQETKWRLADQAKEIARLRQQPQLAFE